MADANFDDEDDLSTLDRGDTFEDEDEIEEEDEVEDEDSENEAITNEDEEEEDEEPVSTKTTKIPKSRLDEVIKQREEAKERNLWLEAQLEQLIANQLKSTTKPDVPVVTYDFATAEEQYITLIIEGETAKATRLRAEIDTNRRQEMLELVKSIQAESSKEATIVSTKAIENDRFSNLVSTYETSYPFLNSEAKEYNEEAVETVNTLLAGYIASGKPKAEALKLAVSKVAPMYTKVVTKSLGNQRTVDATKKAAKASNQQPPKNLKTRVVEVDTTKLDITKMSEKDFSKLTSKELRILRGD
jgi:hypothetical protein